MDACEYTELNQKANSRKRKNVNITDGEGKDIAKYKRDEDSFKVPSASIINESPKANLGRLMMYNMGWSEGKGLGAKNQGITEPVAPSTQLNKHGLGLTREALGIELPETIWTPNSDPASATGDIIVNLEGQRILIDYSDMNEGMVIGERLKAIDNEVAFCDPKLLCEMLKCKTLLDQHKVFLDGRARSNPYEKIGKGIFLNRAAMKMANMDSVMKDLFTNTDDDETLFFADICAGPGGFTEYMLWRKPMESCGFGFTLKVPTNDFRLRDIICGPVECFHPSYGKHDDGDIFNEDNLRKFQQEVLSGTRNVGVHTVLADGGFSVEGQENIQEILSKQLYLCQFLCAINILRTGGNFLCKLFDTFTDFSVGLIYLVSTLFDRVSVIKPITSRPANSERYVIFQCKTDETERVYAIRNYLYEINKALIERKDTDNDVIKVVSHTIMKKDHSFYQFIKSANDKILDQQIMALAKLNAFIIDRNLVDDRQSDIRAEALQQWNVPDIHRDQYKNMKPPLCVNKFIHITERISFEALQTPAKKAIKVLTEKEFVENKFIVRNYYAAFLSHTISEFNQSPYLLVKDKRAVKWYSHVTDRCPEKIPDILKKWSCNVPSFTILLVHFGTEYSGNKGNIKINSTTVVDAALIYGEDISELCYTDRMDKVRNMCALLDPKQKGNFKTLDFFPLHTLFTILKDRMSTKQCKGITPIQQMISNVNDNHFFPPWKLLLINFVRAPWLIAVSRSSGHTYYYNSVSRASVNDKPAELYAPYSESNIFEVDWTGNTDTLPHLSFLNLLGKKP